MKVSQLLKDVREESRCWREREREMSEDNTLNSGLYKPYLYILFDQSIQTDVKYNNACMVNYKSKWFIIYCGYKQLLPSI